MSILGEYKIFQEAKRPLDQNFMQIRLLQVCNITDWVMILNLINLGMDDPVFAWGTGVVQRDVKVSGGKGNARGVMVHL